MTYQCGSILFLRRSEMKLLQGIVCLLGVVCLAFEVANAGKGNSATKGGVKTVKKNGGVIGGSLRFLPAGTEIYHAIKTTGDRDSSGSHLGVFTNPKINPSVPLQTFPQPRPQSCMIQGCTNPAEVGAHVYLDNYSHTQFNKVHIIPTCNFHNNYKGNKKRGQNWDGTGPKNTAQWVKANTPYYIRKLNQKTEAIKGAGKG